MKKIALVFGTRPEIIKLSPIIRLLQRKKRPFVLIHTGQHYSYPMDEQFFHDLKLPRPQYKFTRPSAYGPNQHDKLVAWMQDSIEGALKKEKPDVVLVQGDTDTVLAGAKAAKKTGGILIGHVEAGLRSYDNNMPEEKNRIATDKLSDILFVPTVSAKKNLAKEKLAQGRQVEVTGNTIVDALFENIKIAEERAKKEKRSKHGKYALVTLHRPESVDNKKNLKAVMGALESIAVDNAFKIIFPVHPRTKKRIEEFGIRVDPRLFTGMDGDPMGFLDFIWHEKNAELILTDSGGVQEEACILKVPCVTIRTTTERPETVKAGANVVAGYEPKALMAAAERMAGKKRNWSNPYGDGKTSERILKILDNA